MMKKLKKILSVLTLIVLVGSDILTSFSYALNDIVEGTEIVQIESEDGNEAEDIEDENMEEDVDDENTEVESEDEIDDVSDEIENIDDDEDKILYEGDESGEVDDEGNEDENESISEIQTGSEDGSLDNVSEGEDGIQQEESDVSLDAQDEKENISEIQTGSEEDSLEELPENEDNQEDGLFDIISDGIADIVNKIKYFFNREGNTKYINYGKDENKIGIITLKDPGTSATITIMDKNLGAEKSGVSKKSYGYYFQWGNNHGLEDVNSSNKTTKKAVYDDSFHGHGYDGEGLFIVGGADYWENGAHHNNLWGNEFKESSRQAACPTGYHIPTVKEWNQLINIWGKIHTQDVSINENGVEAQVSRYMEISSETNVHTFKDAVTQCEEGDTECVNEDELLNIIELLSSELRLPLAGSYDENGDFSDGLGVYWAYKLEDGSNAGVFSLNAYIGEGEDETLLHKAQGHNIRCFQDVEKIPEQEEGNILEGENGIQQELDEQVEENIEREEAMDTTGIDMYTITWKNEDGTVIDTTEVAYGEIPTHEDAYQPSDVKYSYVFNGWDKDLEVVTGDVAYTATYKYILREYTIIWKNEDGSEIDTTKVAYGEMPTHEDAYQPADVKYSYVFNGWDKDLEVVTGDTAYTATYKYILRKYTITWKNEDGTVIDTTEVAYGEMPTHADAYQSADDYYMYEFAGWTPEISKVVGDTEYVAKYTYIAVDSTEEDLIGQCEIIDDFIDTQNDEVVEDSHSSTSSNSSSLDVDNQEGETQDSSLDAQDEEDKGFFESIWETLKSFFLEDEDGYLRGFEIIDNIIISVEVEEGAFPEGTEVVIKGVSQDRLESIQTSLIEDESNNVGADAEILAFDISFVYNGEEVQPSKEVSVKFNYKDNTDFQGAKASELSVYHIDDETDEGTEIQVASKDGDEIEILATEFSTYTIVVQRLEEIPEGQPTQTRKYGKDYFIISIAKPSSITETGLPEGIIIMDRNLGATATGYGDGASTDSYGYKYQWGNNYGFSDSATVTAIDTCLPWNSNYNHNGYVSKDWINGSNCNNDVWGSTSADHYDGIWGGENDNIDNRQGAKLTNYEERQGPCPSGWHVPSEGEWGLLIKYWGDRTGAVVNKGYDTSSNRYNRLFSLAEKFSEFQQYFNLPFAGSRHMKSGSLGEESIGRYWSSSSSVNSLNYHNSASNLFLSSSSVTASKDIDAPRAHGYSVRCFKDDYVVPKTNDVTFEPENGSGATTVQVEDGETMTALNPEPTKDGYAFLGWYLSGAESAFDFTGTAITGDITLYAHWIADFVWSETIGDVDVNVDINAKGGTFPEGTELFVELVSQDRHDEIHTDLVNDMGRNLELLAFDIYFMSSGVKQQPTTGVLVKLNYEGNSEFQGASLSDLSLYHIDGTTHELEPIEIVSKNGDEIEFWATEFSEYLLVLQEGEYIVSFVSDDVEVGSGIAVSGNVYTGTIPTPTMSGYTFEYWYLTGAESAFDFSGTTITGDITLYAKWQEYEGVTYTVTFDANRGTFADTPVSQNVSGGEYVTDPATLSGYKEPELPGYIFSGWWTEPRGGTQWDFVNDPVTGDITLYAHWIYNFSYGELDAYIVDSNGTVYKYVMMDRNLGASEVYNQIYTDQNFNSFGYVYQWGNNWGFERCSGNGTTCHGNNTVNPLKSSDTVQQSVWELYVQSKYTRNVWVTVNPWNDGQSDTANLWGYTSNNLEDKQGPCPDGYHVPTNGEFRNNTDSLYKKWKSAYGYTDNTFGSNEQSVFTKQFLLPLAGHHKKGQLTDVDKGQCADYWTSQPLSNTSSSNVWFCKDGDPNYKSKTLDLAGSSQTNNGSTVRCFKNSTDSANLDIVNGGKKGLITVHKVDGVTTINAIKEPENTDANGTGLIFGGWYTSQNFEPSTMKTGGDTLSASVTTLYAKWDCPDGLVYNSNQECVSGVLVRFMDGETEYTRSAVLSGEEVRAPATNPEKAGYIFTGWFESGANLPFVFTGTPITGNLDLYAHWDINNNKYDVNVSVITGDEDKGYLSGMGSTGISLTGLYNYGTELVFIAVPKLGYVFDYWMNGDQVLSGTDLGDGRNQLTVFVDQVLDIIASFKETPTPYTVEHYQENLGQTGYDFVWSGTMYGIANEQTNVTGTNYTGFILSGDLASYQTGINADGSTVVRLYYNRDVLYYTVTFENWNGDFLWSGKVASGETPTYNGSTPSRVSTEQNVYTFDGWYPELSPATMDMTYTATYTESPRLYTVTLTGTPAGYGILTPESLSKEYGAAIVISGDKLTVGGTEVTLTGNEGYDFQEWTGTCGKVDKQVCDEHIIYSHSDPIEFTGGNNLIITNPGYDLFSESNYQKDFEISFDIVDQNLSSSASQATILSVKDEDQSENELYPGFTVRRSGTSNKIEITARGVNGVSAFSKTYNTADVHSVKISRINSILYVSINGGANQQFYNYSGFNNYFVKPITFGSSYKSGDHLFRPAKVTLSNILIKSVGNCYTGNVLAVTGDCQMTAVFTSSGSCTYGGEIYENGSVLTGYQSDSVTCPNSCVPQVATCNNGEWSVNDFETEYGYSSCTYSGFSCDASEYPLPSCPENGICSSCTGYSVSENACVQGTPIYRLDSCSGHYHISGDVCEIDTYNITWTYRNTSGEWVTNSGDFAWGSELNFLAPIYPKSLETKYTLIGWNPALAIVTESTGYTAIYTEEPRPYTITFVSSGENYGTVSPASVTEGYGTPISINNNTITISGTTVIATATGADAQYTYVFSGWNNTCGDILTGDCTITAIFDRTVNEYTVTWKNYDGSVIKTDTGVAYGTTPEYSGDIPEKPSDLIYAYVFEGWTPTISVVHGDQEYTAKYSSTTRRYKVIWRNIDGTVLETDNNVGRGTTPQYNGSIPTNGASNRYVTSTFAGWNPAISAVEKDVEYMARYTYTVTSGYVLDTTKNSINVTLNANGGEFSNNSGYDILNYGYYNRAEKQYSHSSNYSDGGIRNTSATNADDGQYLTTITGAQYLYLNLTYDLHEILLGWDDDNKDKLYVHAGKTVSDELIATFSGNTNDGVQGNENYIISGDSVLLDFYLVHRSLTDVESNGFYAVIVGVIPVGYMTTGEIEVPTRQGYTFDGWYTQAQGGELVNLTGGSISGDMEVFAHWTINNYAVTWNNWNGDYITTTYSAYGDHPVFERDGWPERGRTDAELVYEFIFTGWSRSGSSEIIRELTGLNTEIVTGNVTYIAQYDQRYRDFEVKYHPNGYGEAEGGTGIMGNQILQLHTSGTLIPNTFTRTGYDFTGWLTYYSDGIENPYEDEQEVKLGRADGVDGERDGYTRLYFNLYAQWKARTNTKVTVNYYLKKIDTGNNILIDGVDVYLTGVEYTGTSDSTVDIFSSYGTGIAGYHYDHATVFSGGERTGATETTVLPDGTREINMYYIPNKYNFTLNSDLHSSTQGSSESTGYYYGATITLSGDSNDDCFTWSGWTISGITLPDNTVKQISFTMPINDVEVTPSTTENTYNIIFNGNGNTSGMMSPMNGVKCSESTGLTINAFGKTGHTFTGWSTIAGGSREYTDGATVDRLSTGADVNLYAVWDVNKYNVNASVAAGDHGSLQWSGAGIYEFGETLVIIAVPELGYLLDYWEINGETKLPEGATTGENQLTIVVNQILDIVAHFKADVRTVTVNHYQMNVGGGYTLYETEDNFTGYVGSEFTAIEKEYSGFIASGSSVKTITISGNVEGNIINLYYDRQIYDLRYYVDGIQTGNIESYYFGQSISPRQKPTKEGNTFSGWDDVPRTMPAEDVNIYGNFIINKHWVRFYDDHNGNLILSGEYDYGTPGTSIITPNGSELSKTGNTFSGWVGIPDYMPDHDVDVEAYWDLNFYTIRIKDTSGAVIKSGTYGYGMEVLLECPGMEWEREGYMMTGCSSSMIPEFMPDHGMNIIVRWLPIERNIEVRYHAMNTNGQYPWEWSGIYYTGLTESVFTVPDYTTSGFHYYSYVFNGYTGYDNPVSFIVSGNNSANVIDVYYERERYYIETSGRSYQIPGSGMIYFVEISPDKQPYYQYYYGEEVTLEYLHPYGWIFSGWYDATPEGKGFPPDEMSLDSRNYTFHMPAHNVLVEPIMEHIPYILSFTGYEGAEVTNLEYCSYGTGDREVYFDHSACLPNLSKEGYWFNGWDDENGNWVRRYSDYSPYPILYSMPARDYKLTANFEPRNDMSYEKYYYLQDVEGTGYTLSGTLTDLGDGHGITDQEMPGRAPLYDHIDGFIYTGFGYDSEALLPREQWPIIKATGDNYINYYYDRLTYLVDVDYDNGKMSVTGTGEYRYEAPVILTATTNTGYEFSGFVSERPEYNTTGSTLSFRVPYDFISGYPSIIKAYAKPIEYSIEYELNGGELYPSYYENPTTYTIEDYSTPLYDLVKTGYKFLGWTGGVKGIWEITEPTTGLVITGGSIGDRKYFANFEPDEVSVIVNYYLKRIDSENNVLTGGADVYKKGVIYTGLTDAEVNIQNLYGTGIEGYEYTEAIVYGSDLSGGVETGTTRVLGDETRSIDIYYTPNKYDFEVVQGQNTATSGTSISTGYYYGATVTLSGDSNNDCFMWSGWTMSGITLSDATLHQIGFAMPANAVEVSSVAKEKTYNIIFSGNESTSGEMLPMNGVRCTESTGLILNLFGRDGYTFTGWSTTSGLNSREYTDGQSVSGLSKTNLEDVTLYAVWDVDWYTVTFDLNGGKLTGDMTSTTGYTIKTPAVSLDDYIPYKSGYIFTGWYRDGVLVNSIAGGETGNYTLIANWEPDIVFLHISYLGKMLTGEYYYIMSEAGDYPKVGSFYEAEIKDFSGFTYDPTESKNITGMIVSYDEGQNDIQIYYKRDQYSLEIINDGEGVSNETSGSGDYLYEEPVMISVKALTGWEFVNWTLIEGDLSGVDLSGMILSFNMPAQKIQISPNLNHIEYTVSFNSASGTAVGENQIYYYNDNLSGLDNAITTRTGYDFDGWYLSGVLYTSGSTMPAENITLTAKWMPRTGIQYQVNHRGENTGDNNYEVLLSGYTMYGTSDTKTIAESGNFVGFTLSGDIDQEIINPDGTTVVNIYYDRNVYTITLNNDGGIGVSEITGKYQALIMQPDDPTKLGYEFAGWDPSIPSIMPLNGGESTAKWNPGMSEYTVNYHIERVQTGEYDIYTGVYSGETDSSPRIPLLNPSLTGFITPNQFTGKIIPEGAEFDYYYNRDSYMLYYDTAGGTPLSGRLFRYGEKILTGETERPGYTLITWNNIPEDGNMPAQSGLTLVALREPNAHTKYTVYHLFENLSGGYTTGHSEILSGTTDSLTAAAPQGVPGYESHFDIGDESHTGDQVNIDGDGNAHVEIYYDRIVYQIAFDMNGGYAIEGTGVKFGTYIKSFIDSLSPHKQGYAFSGWNPKFPTTMPDHNLTGMAMWRPTTGEYKVEFYYQLSDGAYSPTPTSGEFRIGTTEWTGRVTDFDKEPSVSGYVFDSTNTGNVLEGRIVGNGSLVLKVYFKRQFTVRYLTGLYGKFGIETYEGLDYGIETPAFGGNTGSHESGYSFIRWSPELREIVTGNVDYIAQWIADTDTEYKVEHYWENEDGTGYDLHETENLRGETDTETGAVAKTYTGLVYSGGHSGNVISGIIEGDGSLVLKLHYDREQYEVTVETSDDDKGTVNGGGTYRYGKKITLRAEPKPGYVFEKWMKNGEVIGTGEEIEVYVEDAMNVTGYFVATGNEYVVEHRQQNVEDNGYKLMSGDTETLTGKTDEQTNAVAKRYEGFSLSGGIESYQTTISADGSTVVKLYYNRNEYEVSYVFTGKVPANQIGMEPASGSYRYGATVNVAEVRAESGYEFSWSTGVTSFVMPANNVEIVGRWTAKTGTEYKVEYYWENEEGTGYDLHETENLRGETDTETGAEVKTYTGLVYSGGHSGNVISGVIEGDGSLVLKLHYDREQYEVTVETSDENKGTVNGGGTYRYGKKITLRAEAKPGYVFEKWMKNGEVIGTGEEIEVDVNTGMEISAEFKARTDTPYYVEYYKENLDGGYDVRTGIYSGTTDQSATAQELSFTGFTYDSGNVNNLTTGNIDGDASRVLKLYYNREIYTIMWLNEDGTDMDTTTVKYGEIPTHAIPTQPADVHYTYEFAGWDPEPTAATGGASYRATYNYIVNKYTITWRNDDGSLIDTTKVEYGVVPTHANPRKADTEDYKYTFAGWTPDVVSVVGDAEYIATYTAEQKEKPSKGGNMSGGGGRKTDNSDNQHGSAGENSGLFTGDNATGDIDDEILSLYQWARQNDITTMDTLEDANSEGLLTRGHMAKMAVNFAENVLGKHTPTVYPDKCNWNDRELARESSEIKEYAKKACALGLMGIYVDEFMPNKILDRAEFGTIISRLLWGDRYNIIDTAHRSYYEDHLWALKKHGILTQTDNPEDRWEIRKWVWLVFRRISEKLNK